MEEEPGFGEAAQGDTVPGKIDNMGYKGVETTQLVKDTHPAPRDLPTTSA